MDSLLPEDRAAPSAGRQFGELSEATRVTRVGGETERSLGSTTPRGTPSRANSRWLRSIERILVAAAMVIVVWFYYWTTDANSGFDDWSDMDYYRMLVHGWRKGQLHLDFEPSPELLALADPYDPYQNSPHKLGDVSLYANKYYIYFGPTPAATLMMPFWLVTGRDLTMGGATFVFASIAFLAASGLWLAIRRRFFPESRMWVAPCGVLALGFGTHLLALAQRPMFWELAIASGIAFSTLAAGAAYRALGSRRPWAWMAAAGLCIGLAVGSRPTCLFAAPLLLAPVWFAWRENRAGPRWWRMGLAAAVPLGLCGVAIMAHNYARFDNPFEWGQNYQLSGAYESKLTHFSLGFIRHNFLTYFFHPLDWTAEFPFALATGAPECSAPGYFGTEEVAGLAVTFPFFWFALALPLAWRRRGGHEGWRLTAAVACVAGYAFPVMLLVLGYFSTTMRYEADFAVATGVLALVGLLALERGAQTVCVGWRRAVTTVAVGASLVTVIVGALVSFDYHGRSMQVTSPGRWRALDHGLDAVVAKAGRWLGKLEGPRVLKVRFQPKPPGTIEPFWRATDPRVPERIVVEHIGERLIRFGYTRGAAPIAWGRPLKWELNHTHTVHVQVPSLYPPPGHNGWSDVRRRLEFRERTGVAVWFSGGRALDTIAEPVPAGTVPGGAVAQEFSGEVRSMATRLFREDEIPTGLAEPYLPRGGFLRMRVFFPDRMREKGEPLFACGAHYRSSIVFLQPEKGGLKFVFENYTHPRVESAVFRPSPRGHLLELEMPNFDPKKFGEEKTGDVVVRLDGKEMLRTRQVGYSFHWGNEEIGTNPFGTTCEPAFRGWILDARYILPPAPAGGRR